MFEKRYAPRYEVAGECKLKVLYSGKDPKRVKIQTLKARYRNVSEGGLYIETTEPFQEGDLADCTFHLGGKATNSLGLIKWQAGGTGVGIEFFHGSEEERNSLRQDLRGSISSA